MEEEECETNKRAGKLKFIVARKTLSLIEVANRGEQEKIF